MVSKTVHTSLDAILLLKEFLVQYYPHIQIRKQQSKKVAPLATGKQSATNQPS